MKFDFIIFHSFINLLAGSFFLGSRPCLILSIVIFLLIIMALVLILLNSEKGNTWDRGIYAAWPKKVIGLYVLLADDTVKGSHTRDCDDDKCRPRLHEYQQKGANVLFFTFINPESMTVPNAFQKLAKTRGLNEEGAVPEETVIIFAIGEIRILNIIFFK